MPGEAGSRGLRLLANDNTGRPHSTAGQSGRIPDALKPAPVDTAFGPKNGKGQAYPVPFRFCSKFSASRAGGWLFFPPVRREAVLFGRFDGEAGGFGLGLADGTLVPGVDERTGDENR